ncbi:MAG: hypothetical protein K6E85_00880 [Lachnospiraceae bacterium]|nr:hypothetical protein [Lachnospiraceae bacterium]
MVFCCNYQSGRNKANDRLVDFFDHNGADDIDVFLGVKFDDRSIGTVIVMEKAGVFIFDAKPFRANEIKDVKPGGIIQFTKRPPEYSPLSQAIDGLKTLGQIVKNNGILLPLESIIPIVCFPFIQTDEYSLNGMEKVAPKELSLLAEDFSSIDALRGKLLTIYEFTRIAQDETKRSINLDEQLRTAFGKMLYKDYENVKAAVSDKAGQKCDEMAVSTKKDLYYQISTILMRKKIVKANIFSDSKELLDGFGDYLSAIGIPWRYGEMPGMKGYSLFDGSPHRNYKDTTMYIREQASDTVLIKTFYGLRYDALIKVNESVRKSKFDLAKPPLHLKNEEIREAFNYAFDIVEEELDIHCPWINNSVVNTSFINMMRRVLERGVRIKIRYGIDPGDSEYDISRSVRSDEVAANLMTVLKEYGSLLSIRRKNSHYKVVLCDEKLKLEGSFNYLSSTEDFSDSNSWSEGSPFGTDPLEIRKIRKEYFGDE